ncbi:hypothetical protein G4B88_028264 [Cannabis sativa]|uniref:Ubiquitin-like protease family profile domain-containing protein n=1 Tax=Cannabis sativa TaxID=3483 RepID=A0A7J6GD70_CANSA|nr:hypothetical protein G4B88_028264 [Cannabis sativa]
MGKLIVTHDKDKVYLKGKDKIVPPFRFVVEDVATKMWFHKLAYPGQCLTNSTESHWILGRLNIEERRMYMYNSLSTAMKDSAAIKACQPFAVLLPHFFALFDEFKKENKPVCLDPFEVVKVDGLPQQTSNDCGCFVASFAEYFIDMKPIPPIFDVEKHRDRLAVLFYKYARMKEVDFIDSEDEAPPKDLGVEEKFLEPNFLPTTIITNQLQLLDLVEVWKVGMQVEDGLENQVERQDD